MLYLNPSCVKKILTSSQELRLQSQLLPGERHGYGQYGPGQLPGLMQIHPKQRIRTLRNEVE